MELLCNCFSKYGIFFSVHITKFSIKRFDFILMRPYDFIGFYIIWFVWVNLAIFLDMVHAMGTIIA